MPGTVKYFLATTSIAALAVGAASVTQAADLFAGAGAIFPEEFNEARTISGAVGIFGSFSSPVMKSEFTQFACGATMITSIAVSPCISAMMAMARSTSD